LFLKEQRAAGEPRRQRDRGADVAAGAQHHVRTLDRHQHQRLDQADDVDQRRPWPAPWGAPREATGGDEAQPEAGLGNRLRLEAALATHEHHLIGGPDAAQLLGHRDAGIDVPAGPAARDHDLHRVLRDQLSRVSASFEPLRMLMR
jgi:hypothetical protein